MNHIQRNLNFFPLRLAGMKGCLLNIQKTFLQPGFKMGLVFVVVALIGTEIVLGQAAPNVGGKP